MSTAGILNFGVQTKKFSPNYGSNITLRHKNFACVKRGANLTTKPYELPYYLIENRAFKAPPR